jgi:hypothetical protein
MQVEAYAQVLRCWRRAAHATVITVAVWLSALAMDPEPTGLSAPAFTAPNLPIALGVVYRRHRQAGQARVTDLMAAPAPYAEIGGADPMAPSGCAPEIVGTRESSTFGAAARYRRATVGSSHDDVQPDNSALHTD